VHEIWMSATKADATKAMAEAHWGQMAGLVGRALISTALPAATLAAIGRSTAAGAAITGTAALAATCAAIGAATVLAGAAAAAGRAGGFENLHLGGRQNLGQLSLGVLLELLDLLLLVIGQIEFLFGKSRDEMEAGGRRAATAGTAAGTTRAALTSPPAATLSAPVLRRWRISPRVLCQGAHGDRCAQKTHDCK
jgi:hypothetical protein